MAAQLLTTALAAAFGLSELALSLRRRSLRAAARSDRGSLHLLWILIVGGWVLALELAAAWPVGHFAVAPALLGLALAVFAGGVALRWWAILTLGRLFTVDVAIAADHRLVQSGPYRLIRHPSYAGALLAFVGLGLTLGSLPALAAVLLPAAFAYAYRIAIEEAALQRGLGAAYAQYARRTRRLIPWIY